MHPQETPTTEAERNLVEYLLDFGFMPDEADDVAQVALDGATAQVSIYGYEVAKLFWRQGHFASEHEELVRLVGRDLFRKLLPKLRDDFSRGLLSLAHLRVGYDLALIFAAKEDCEKDSPLSPKQRVPFRHFQLIHGKPRFPVARIADGLYPLANFAQRLIKTRFQRRRLRYDDSLYLATAALQDAMQRLCMAFTYRSAKRQQEAIIPWDDPRSQTRDGTSPAGQ